VAIEYCFQLQHIVLNNGSQGPEVSFENSGLFILEVGSLIAALLRLKLIKITP
jgi:hypothetical protein